MGLVVIHAMAAATSLHAQEFCPARFTALPPVTLVSGESVHVDTPQPALGPSGLLLIGRETTVWRSADPDAPSLLLPDSVAGLVSSGPGRPWRLFPRPPGAAELIYPAVVTNGRVLHMVWGAGPDSNSTTVHELWHATLDSAGWSPARAIVTGRTLQWANLSSASLALIGDTLLIVVPGSDSAGGSIALLRLANGDWRESPVLTAGFRVRYFFYASLATRPGEVHVAFIAPDPGTRRDGNSLWVVRSGDGGRTWSAPELVHRSGRVVNAHSPHLMRIDDSTLALVWAHAPFGRPFPHDGFSMAIAQGPAGWHRGPSLSIPGDFARFHMASDAHGRIHLLSFPGDGSGLLYARWAEGGWCTLPLPGTTAGSATLALFPAGRDSVFVFWAEPRDPRGYVPVTRAGLLIPVDAARGRDR